MGKNKQLSRLTQEDRAPTFKGALLANCIKYVDVRYTSSSTMNQLAQSSTLVDFARLQLNALYTDVKESILLPSN